MRWLTCLLFFLMVLSACSKSEAPVVVDAGCPQQLGFRFQEIAAASGLNFEHFNGADGRKLLPETLGSGAAFLDYDGDGHLDIFLVNGTSWSDQGEGRRRGFCALYRGQGEGRFLDVSAETAANIEIQGMGCSVADVDHDGDQDIFITSVYDNVLLVNDNGVFVDGTAAAGLAGGKWQDADDLWHEEWSTASVFFDADGDGDLDLWVCNYCEWSIAGDIFTTLDGVTKAFTTPEYYRGIPCRLFLNDGSGHFEDVTVTSGLSEHRGKALGVAVWDFDGDGLEEVVVANDTRPNFFFKNLGGGRFQECGIEVGIAYDELGRARAGMGIDIATRMDDQGAVVAIGNFAFEPVSLYRRRETGNFDSIGNQAGLSLSTFQPLTFGLLFADLNLDSQLDLFLVNGHIEPDINEFQEQQEQAQLPQLQLGQTGGRFAMAEPVPGCALLSPLVGRGLAQADLDDDGDLDLLITTNGGPVRLLRNDLINGSTKKARFLRVTLAQAGPNPQALGARVKLFTSTGVLEARVRGGSSYLSQSECVLTFGLAEHQVAERLEVRWPGGSESQHALDPNETRVHLEN